MKDVSQKQHPLISVHHINTQPINTILDETVLFEVQVEKQANHTFTVPLSDLRITRKIISGTPAMEMTN